MRWLTVALSLMVLFVPGSISANAEDDPAVRFNAVELRDCFGKPHPLSALKESKVVVVAFLGTECPLAKLHGPRLQTLSERSGMSLC